MFLLNMLNNKLKLPAKSEALPGRDEKISTAEKHFVNGNPINPPFPKGMETVILGMGCFWGVERIFWQKEGVYVTAVGYSAGHTQNPTYNEVCTGMTGHNEVVLVVFDSNKISFDEILQTFWEGHDPTQGMRQGNDTGTQYRSGIYVNSKGQKEAALASLELYQEALNKAGISKKITTEILNANEFFYAEEYHQQYLAKNPEGYCGIGGTGVSCPSGIMS